jgi:signal transduction histidine kinase
MRRRDRHAGDRRHSLRFRLLIGGAVWTLVALNVVGVVIAKVFNEIARERAVAELVAERDRVAAFPFDRLPPPPGVLDERTGRYWWIVRSDGGVTGSAALGGFVPRTEGDAGETIGPLGSPIAFATGTITVAGRPERLFTAVETGDSRSLIRALHHPLVTGMLLLALLFLIAVALQVEFGLRPLAVLTRRLDEMRAGRLARLPPEHPPEIARLVEALNALRDADEERATRAERQAGNLAHALKTDLAALAIDVEEMTADRLDETRERALETVTRAARRVDHHAARARAALRGDAPVRVPAAPVLNRLVGVLNRLYAGRGITITGAFDADAAFPGDERDLEEIAGNLADNAAKWCRTRVLVSARAGNGALVIVVEDDGPGLPPEERERATAPGVRLDESVPGTGLGLAVARDLAELHGGGLSLETAETGGLRAVVRLPAAPCDPQSATVKA